MGALRVGVEVRQLSRLYAAALQQAVEVPAADANGEPQGGELAVSDQPVDRVWVEVEELRCPLNVYPLVDAIRHRSVS